MDQESYDQVALNKKILPTSLIISRNRPAYTILYFEGKPIAVRHRTYMELSRCRNFPGVRGDTAQGAAIKPANLESGLVLSSSIIRQ